MFDPKKAKFLRIDGLPPNLREFASETTWKLVMVIEAKNSWWFGPKKGGDLVIEGVSGPPPPKVLTVVL